MTDPKVLESASTVEAWTEPGESLCVYVRQDVLRDFCNETQRGLKLLPQRGAEVGGLLWGTVINPQTVIIQGIESVPCEYQLGPTWTLSPQDKTALVDTFQTSPQLASGLMLL